MEESLKLGLIEQYVENQVVLHVLPHARLSYYILSLKYMVLICALGLLIQWINIDGTSIQAILGAIGIAIFSKYMYDFLDKYLDTVILTNKGITIVKIDNWFSYKVDFFEWKSIIAISHSQSGLLDKVFDQGSLKISLDHDSDYEITSISTPGKQSSTINKYKFDALARTKQEESEKTLIQESQPDKFELLVDTLSDVIGMYMKQNPKD